MAHLAEVIEVSGEVDFESLNPVLVEESGRRWRLQGRSDLLVGDCVTLSATREDCDTLRVRAVAWVQWGPRLHCD